jgi:hypothetical protein
MTRPDSPVIDHIHKPTAVTSPLSSPPASAIAAAADDTANHHSFHHHHFQISTKISFTLPKAHVSRRHHNRPSPHPCSNTLARGARQPTAKSDDRAHQRADPTRTTFITTHFNPLTPNSQLQPTLDRHFGCLPAPAQGQATTLAPASKLGYGKPS